ncbi:hypothetical protein HDU85_005912 [Gaertneriomyces sp. JEL0708]|nr:hypothetical protein HDU85_005912 [Gaertneriomyces sp. JEL0708]
MTVEVFKRDIVYTPQRELRDKRHIFDFSDGCGNAIYTETMIPDNMNLRVILSGDCRMAYYDLAVLAKHSYVFTIFHKKDLLDRGLLFKDVDDESPESTKEREGMITNIKCCFSSYEKFVTRQRRPNGRYLYDLKLDEFNKCEEALLDILDWCYSEDDSVLNINLDNVYKFLRVTNLLVMSYVYSGKFNNAIVNKVRSLDISSHPDTLDRLYDKCVYVGDCDVTVDSYLATPFTELPDKPGVELLLIPVLLCLMLDEGICVDILEACYYAERNIIKYGTDNILKYLNRVPSQSIYMYNSVMMMAKILYTDHST